MESTPRFAQSQSVHPAAIDPWVDIINQQLRKTIRTLLISFCTNTSREKVVWGQFPSEHNACFTSTDECMRSCRQQTVAAPPDPCRLRVRRFQGPLNMNQGPLIKASRLRVRPGSRCTRAVESPSATVATHWSVQKL
jgi:hypothetical protein